jgi:microcystin degradation protein MlrC
MIAMTKRVLLGGLFHETHTFLDGTTPLEDFSVRRGDELLDASGDGSPLSGVLEVADACGWDVIPTIDLRAMPSATVEDDVFECFWQDFGSAAARQIPLGLDGIYLVLHGAMACRSFLDPEGEIIDRIRRLPGSAEIPICGVLDLHGNISQSAIEQTQGLIAYRRNPHTDAREAAVRGAQLLDRILSAGKLPVSVWEQPPLMWPPTGVGTDDDPMKTLEAKAREIEQAGDDIAAVNVMAGYSFADTPMTGVSFAAMTFGDPQIARDRLRELSAWAIGHRQEGNRVDTPLADVIDDIRSGAVRGAGPIAVVEPADNIGGGAPGDGTSILRALIEHQIDESAVVINDPEAVAALQALSPGERAQVSIGGKGSWLADGPLTIEVELLSRSDGRFRLEDPHSHLASMSGMQIDMGPCVTVRHCFGTEDRGVRILLTSRKTPPFDLGQLRSQGIEPEKLSVIGVKAAVAHRQAYDKITRASYTVSTPGPCSSDLQSFPFRHIRRPVFPLDDIG